MVGHKGGKPGNGFRAILQQVQDERMAGRKGGEAPAGPPLLQSGCPIHPFRKGGEYALRQSQRDKPLL